MIDPGLFALHSTVAGAAGADAEAAAGDALPERCVVGTNMLRYHLRPVAKQGLDEGA